MDREQLIADFTEFMVESMDIETLVMVAQDMLRAKYSQLSEGELLAEVREFAPNLIEEDF